MTVDEKWETRPITPEEIGMQLGGERQMSECHLFNSGKGLYYVNLLMFRRLVLIIGIVKHECCIFLKKKEGASLI